LVDDEITILVAADRLSKMIINPTAAAEEEEEEEEERGAVLRGDFFGKILHAHFLLIARFLLVSAQRWLILRSMILLVSAAAIADPEIDSLSFCRNEIDSLEFLQQSVDHESNFLFRFCSSQ
jgi:hypothetical protein